jgi:hypothetical protein
MPPRSPARRVDPDPRLVAEYADYSDAFRIDGPPGHHAREWAQLCLRGAEANGSLFGRLVWQGVLGFRLLPPGTGSVAGWRVIVDDPHRLVLHIDGWLMAGQMVFQASGPALTWTTMLRYHRPPAWVVWAVAGRAHRVLVPRCLGAARHDLEQSTAQRGRSERDLT